ncbi:hypothetical protein TNCV_1476591 [Trichonephila clavipes]|nr:hypothetical protein TNCV_1476591 [Trichonephila clavipes]
MLPNNLKIDDGRYESYTKREALESNTRSNGDRPRNFNPRLSDEDRTFVGISLFKEPHHANGKTLNTLGLCRYRTRARTRRPLHDHNH